MKNRILTILSAALLSVGSLAFAQDLDTVTVVDQFSSGSRSDQANGATYSAPTYPGITGSINYYTTFTANTAGETPVLDVTLTTNDPDGAGPTPALPANTDGFSTSPSFAVFVGDGGGGQNLTFGEENDANYYIRASVYCAPHTTATAGEFERLYISARVGSLVGTTFDTGNNTDAIGGYGLAFESDTATFLAVKWNPTKAGVLTGAEAGARDALARTVFAESAPITVGGWHVLEINCYDQLITYKVDGVELASVSDAKWTSGQASLSYRELFTPTAPNEYQAQFDYMQAGPGVAPTAAETWPVYE